MPYFVFLVFNLNGVQKCHYAQSFSEVGILRSLFRHCSSQCSMTGVTKAIVCVILSGMMHIKRTLAANWKE